MSPKELRVGNLVYSRTGIIKVVDVINATTRKIEFDDSDDDYDLSECNPIPLTEELIESLGITRNSDLNWWNLPEGNPYKAHHLMQMANGWTWFIEFDPKNCHLIKGFNYAHELQNLCFELTEQELVYHQ